MKPIDINLATRPFRNNTLYWAGFGSAVLALAAVSVLNVWLFFGYGSTMRRHQEDLAGKQQRREGLARDEQRLGMKLAKLDFKGLAQQSEFANDAIRRRIFSWTELFNRLEEVVPPSVMMISIRPEIQAEGISVVAEGSAKDQEGLLQFEENLIRNPRFARIYPGSERREQRGQDLRFSLKFDYVPGDRPVLGAPVPAVAKGPEKPAPEEKPATQPAAAGTGTAPAAGSTVAPAAARRPPPLPQEPFRTPPARAGRPASPPGRASPAPSPRRSPGPPGRDGRPARSRTSARSGGPGPAAPGARCRGRCGRSAGCGSGSPRTGAAPPGPWPSPRRRWRFPRPGSRDGWPPSSRREGPPPPGG